jgi:hypothetical protein
MYIESKFDLSGPARIGRVTFSKSGRSVYYDGRRFARFTGFKANHYDVATGDEYWISGPRRDGADRLYGERVPVPIDEDVRHEYWTEIRAEPTRTSETDANR